MYGIAAAAAVGYLVLLILSRKEDTVSDIPSYLVPFYRMALYLLKRIWLKFPKLFSSAQVERDLAQLHPEESKECMVTEYYTRKTALCLAVIFIGTILAAAVRISAKSGLALGEDGMISRGNYQEGAAEISIAADYGRQQMEFRLQVEPRHYTEAESEELFDDFLEWLPEHILGENVSLQNVTKDLVLKDDYDSFPISVDWKSDKQYILSNTGRVSPVEKPEQIRLMLYMSCSKYCREAEIMVTVVPPVVSEKEKLYLEVEQMLQQSHNDSLEQEYWKLPAEWKGERIYWKQIIEDNSLLLWGAVMGTVVLIYLFSDRDLHEQTEQRKKRLRREYPEIVHKLVLFVGAGMTIRGAFQKIAGDYEAKQKAAGKFSPACAEMLYTCRELCAGVSEGAAYEHFGRRTGLQEYIRLSTLLTQNIKRGNSTLLERLREEADKAAEAQLQQGRKLGEEAGTKLLVPMVFMLAVVMALIMIPAFSNM